MTRSKKTRKADKQEARNSHDRPRMFALFGTALLVILFVMFLS